MKTHIISLNCRTIIRLGCDWCRFVSHFSADRQIWLVSIACTHLRRNLGQMLREIKRIAAFILWHFNANYTLEVHFQATPFSFLDSFIKIFFRAVARSQLLTHTHTHACRFTRTLLLAERERARACSRERVCMCVSVCVCVCSRCRYVCFAIVFRAKCGRQPSEI